MNICMLLVSLFSFVELNCENLFDCHHDTLKSDTEFLPEGTYRWTPYRYWRKLNRVGQTILACGGEGSDWSLPDMVALCEVENDTVMRDLTQRSLLRKARYEYVMTSSPDDRGIDVALLYSPFSFALLNHRSVRVKPVDGMDATRDILYVSGMVHSGDTIHVVVVHFPSRRGGELYSRPFRITAARQVRELIDSVKHVSGSQRIIVAGDFNDYAKSESMNIICNGDMKDVSDGAIGNHGAKGTYRYRGKWGSLDHIVVSENMVERIVDCKVMDAEFLLCTDDKYGGVQPRRNYLGPKYLDGFSDHLPLVARFDFDL